jgi:DNA-binding CsgD family transcriptional regulator
MPEGNELLDTIEAVHAAGLGEKLWPDVLAGVAKLFGGAAASLEIFKPPAQAPVEFHAFGIPPAGELAYLETYAALNPRAAFAFGHANQDLLWDYQVLDERAMNRDPFYTWLQPQADLRYFLAGQFYRVPGECVGISVHRTRRQGHVQTPEVALMKRLLPHFRQALDTAMRLRRASAFGTSLEGALDWLADGVALIGDDGRVLYANESLQAIARRGDGIRIRRGAIEFAAADAGARFAAALAGVRRLRGGNIGAASADDFPVQRPSAPPYLVSIRPLARGASGHDRELHTTAIVFVHDPLQRVAGMIRMLREVFGLTEAEASVADALHAGKPLGDYARERKVSLNTVYTHLRRIKEKTGCTRMAELIRKLNDLRVPLRVD